MTTDELDRLEQIAKAATPGPWKATGLQYGCFYILTDDESGMVADDAPDAEVALARARGYGQGLPMEANAAHIAAFNPQTALRLLAEVTRLTAERDALAQQVDDLEAHLDCVAHGLHHYSGCTNHFAGPKPGVECCRCRAEQAESALTTAQQDAARLREALRMLQIAVLDATDDAENCEECGIVADSTDADETACAIHRSQPIWQALLAAWEVLGPCVCGHPRSQHREEDSAACLTCACEWFKLPNAAALTAPADPTGGQ